MKPVIEEDTPTQVVLSMDFIDTGGQMSFGKTESDSSVKVQHLSLQYHMKTSCISSKYAAFLQT